MADVDDIKASRVTRITGENETLLVDVVDVSGVNKLAIDGSVEVTSSVLPTGASTEAKQDTGNSSLSNIDGKVATEAKQDVANSSLSSIDGKVSTETKQDAQIVNQAITHGRLGDQTETAPASDTASSGLNGRLQRVAQRLTTAITSLTTLNTRVGDLTETAPANDTASSGLNGRLQRIAQRLTSIFTAQSDGTQQSKIRGNTDGTLIGNLGDRLKTVVHGLREDATVGTIGSSNNNALKVSINDRLSEVRDRTNVTIPITRTSLVGTPTVFYTVTANSTLYITSFTATALNSSASDGQFTLRDDTTVLADFLVPSRISGSSPSSFTTASPGLIEPLQFSTDVNLIEVTGSIEIGGFLIGYEEPN